MEDCLCLFFTWQNLCTEPCCISISAEQNNGVGKRRGCPGRMGRSLHAVIVFDKDGDCKGLLFADIFVELNRYWIENEQQIQMTIWWWAVGRGHLHLWGHFIIIVRHLIVKRGVQLVLPAAQEMQVLKKLLESSLPPQTTSLPPDSRERLCSLLGWGRSGMKQVSEGGRGNSSTFERTLLPPLPLLPPTTTCPDASVHHQHQPYCQLNNQHA